MNDFYFFRPTEVAKFLDAALNIKAPVLDTVHMGPLRVYTMKRDLVPDWVLAQTPTNKYDGKDLVTIMLTPHNDFVVHGRAGHIEGFRMLFLHREPCNDKRHGPDCQVYHTTDPRQKFNGQSALDVKEVHLAWEKRDDGRIYMSQAYSRHSYDLWRFMLTFGLDKKEVQFVRAKHFYPQEGMAEEGIGIRVPENWRCSPRFIISSLGVMAEWEKWAEEYVKPRVEGSAKWEGENLPFVCKPSEGQWTMKDIEKEFRLTHAKAGIRDVLDLRALWHTYLVMMLREYKKKSWLSGKYHLISQLRSSKAMERLVDRAEEAGGRDWDYSGCGVRVM